MTRWQGTPLLFGVFLKSKPNIPKRWFYTEWGIFTKRFLMMRSDPISFWGLRLPGGRS